MQHTNYPLPPLMLTEVIARARHDHEHRHNDGCVEDSDYCQRATADNADLYDEPQIVSIAEGAGRHECDDTCEVSSYAGKCLRHCEDSDWLVELEYSRRGWRALYGIKRAGDVQDVSLWAD